MHTIEVEHVHKSYGPVTALDGVSLSVERGETFGLVGTNGAGKTTLFRLLVGHETPDEGAIEVAGHAPSDGVAVREHVGFVPEDAGFEPALTGREVLGYYARLRDVPADDREHRIRRVLSTVGLADAADRTVDGYSNGMSRRLALATTLLTQPDVLLLDEPTAGLDPEGVADFHDLVRRVGEADVTVVLTSHDLREVETLCDRVAVLDGGRAVAEGPVSELRARVGDRVTLTARVADSDDARAALDDHADVSVERAGDPLVVDCPQGEAGDVLDAVRAATAVDRFEVRQPGLTAAFRESVDDGRRAAAGGETP